MSTVQEIEAAIPRLSRVELEQLRAWFEDYLEDQLELSDEVKAKLDESRKEIAASASPEAITPAKKRNKPTGRSTRLSESPREFKMEKKEKTEKMTSSPVVAGRGAAARSTRVRGAPNDSLFHVK